MVTSTTQPKGRSRFRVGDRVAFSMLPYQGVGVLVEDRGLLGQGGARIWRIRVDVNGGDPLEFELREEHLRAPI